MAEETEGKKELEKATETDIRLMFGDLKKPLEAMQAVLVSAIEKLRNDGIDPGRTRVQIEDGEITLWFGGYCLWYRVSESVWKSGE